MEIYIFFEPLKVRKMVIWAMTSGESNNYLDIILTSESSDSVLSSEDKEVIEMLRKTEKNLNYMVKFQFWPL
jgi:hypothetical protein